MRLRLAIAVLCLIVAIMAFGAEVLTSFRADHYRILSLAELWTAASADGFAAVQAALDGIPILWDPILMTLFRLPAWFLPLLLSLIFFYLARRRPPAGKRKIFR